MLIILKYSYYKCIKQIQTPSMITNQGRPPGSTNILAPSSLTFPKLINSASGLSITDFSFKEPSWVILKFWWRWGLEIIPLWIVLVGRLTPKWIWTCVLDLSDFSGVCVPRATFVKWILIYRHLFSPKLFLWKIQLSQAKQSMHTKLVWNPECVSSLINLYLSLKLCSFLLV